MRFLNAGRATTAAWECDRLPHSDGKPGRRGQAGPIYGRVGRYEPGWGRFALPETRAVYAACKQIAPAAVIDMHSWDVTDPFQANSVEGGTVVNATSVGLAQAAIQLQRSMITVVRQSTGQSVSALSYSPMADTSLCHRFFAAQGTPAVLVETGRRDERQPRGDAVPGAVRFSGVVGSNPGDAVRYWPRSERTRAGSFPLPRVCRHTCRPHRFADRRTPASATLYHGRMVSERRKAVRLGLALYAARLRRTDRGGQAEACGGVATADLAAQRLNKTAGLRLHAARVTTRQLPVTTPAGYLRRAAARRCAAGKCNQRFRLKPLSERVGRLEDDLPLRPAQRCEAIAARGSGVDICAVVPDYRLRLGRMP